MIATILSNTGTETTGAKQRTPGDAAKPEGFAALLGGSIIETGNGSPRADVTVTAGLNFPEGLKGRAGGLEPGAAAPTPAGRTGAAPAGTVVLETQSAGSSEAPLSLPPAALDGPTPARPQSLEVLHLQEGDDPIEEPATSGIVALTSPRKPLNTATPVFNDPSPTPTFANSPSAPEGRDQLVAPPPPTPASVSLLASLTDGPTTTVTFGNFTAPSAVNETAAIGVSVTAQSPTPNATNFVTASVPPKQPMLDVSLPQASRTALASPEAAPLAPTAPPDAQLQSDRASQVASAPAPKPVEVGTPVSANVALPSPLEKPTPETLRLAQHVVAGKAVAVAPSSSGQGGQVLPSQATQLVQTAHSLMPSTMPAGRVVEGMTATEGDALVDDRVRTPRMPVAPSMETSLPKVEGTTLPVQKVTGETVQRPDVVGGGISAGTALALVASLPADAVESLPVERAGRPLDADGSPLQPAAILTAAARRDVAQPLSAVTIDAQDVEAPDPRRSTVQPMVDGDETKAPSMTPTAVMAENETNLVPTALRAQPLPETPLTAQATPLLVSDPRPLVDAAPSDPSGPKPAPKPFAESLLAQVRAVAVEDGRTSVQLQPRGLGTIEVEMYVESDVVSKVVVRVENTPVLNTLRDERQMLAQTIGIADSNVIAFEERPAGDRSTGGNTEDEESQVEMRTDTETAKANTHQDVLSNGVVDVLT